MQILNKRFYTKFAPALIYEFKLFEIGTVSRGFFLLSHSSQIEVLDPENSLE
jgi:hypothetical protein